MVFKRIKNFIFLFIFYYILYVAAFFASLFASVTLIINSFRNPVGIFKVKRRELPPEILNEPIYGQHKYVQIKNVKLHYVENGDTSKPLMIFLHGFPDFWFSWKEQIKHYSKYYWTVAVDLRGYGDSEKPANLSSYQIKYLVEDLKNLLDVLGGQNVVLVSHDWGGIVASYFILKYPELISKYITLNICPPYGAQICSRQLLRSWYIYFFQLPYFPEIFLRSFDLDFFDALYEKSGDDVIEAYKFTFGKPGAFTYPVNYYRANFFNVVKSLISRHKILQNGFKNLKDIPFPPGLVIYGEKDKYVDAAGFKSVTEIVPNLKAEMLAGEGHFVHQYKPDLVHQVMDKFLDISASETTGSIIQEKSLLSDNKSS